MSMALSPLTNRFTCNQIKFTLTLLVLHTCLIPIKGLFTGAGANKNIPTRQQQHRRYCSPYKNDDSQQMNDDGLYSNSCTVYRAADSTALIQRRSLISYLGVVGLSTLFTAPNSVAVAAAVTTSTGTSIMSELQLEEIEEECSNGKISPEGSIPGAYQNTCMGLPERSIVLKSTGDEIKIYQGTNIIGDKDDSKRATNNSDGSVAGRTGVALWNSGLLLTRLLDEIAFQQKEIQINGGDYHSFLFGGKTVVELGCGTGLTSITASKLGASYVYASDGNAEVLELSKFNLERNGIFSKRSGEAVALQWGSLDAIDYYDVADVVIGSDLTYNSGSWRVLADSFSSILKPNGYVLYLTLGHSGFNVSGELNGFLTVIQSAGVLEIVDENSREWPFPGVGSLERLLLSSLSAKEVKLTNSTGGFRIVVLKRKQRRLS